MKVWESKLHAGFHPRKFLCGILLGQLKCWTILDFLAQSCSLPLQTQAELWLLLSSEDTGQKLVKSPLAQFSQLKSILPKWEKLIRAKKCASTALETVSHFLYSLYYCLPLREEFLFSPSVLRRRGTGFSKLYCMYLSVTCLLIITKSMINLSQIGLLSNPIQANAFLSPAQKAALCSDFTSVCTKAHIQAAAEHWWRLSATGGMRLHHASLYCPHRACTVVYFLNTSTV